MTASSASSPSARPGRPSRFNRRDLLRGGVAVTAVGAVGLGTAGTAHAAPRPALAPLGSRAAEPRIYTTEEWGARAPSDEIVVENHVPTFIVVHHTADPGNSEDYSLEHAKKIARDIQNLHMDQNGWADSGQQFTNSRGGFRLEGRHQSLGVVRGGTQHVQGANVGGHNSEVIGIENEGMYRDVDVPAALWDSLVQLVAWIAGQYGTELKNIQGHRDFNSTECPGDVLYRRLPELREAVGQALGTSAPDDVPGWPLLKPGSAGAEVRAAQHLLRAKGYRVPVDGVFGTDTRNAVAELSARHGIEQHTCSASYHRTADETGYLGSDVWPLITAPSGAPGGGRETDEAVRTLVRKARGGEVPSGELAAEDWKRLLA